MVRATHNGPQRKLVIAIDIGTTFSGVSYCLLEPGRDIEVKGVTRFPGQEHVGGDCKIPTVIWYDEAGNVQAAGAEATREGISVDAEESGWSKAEWFKVFFRPRHLNTAVVSDKVPPLPLGKTVLEVFADFLRYIFKCTKTYIHESYPDGTSIWNSVENDIEFILTHPNGYEGHQQDLMRQAAVLAGLVPDYDSAQARVSLVTEGEASLHYCIDSGITADFLKSGKGVMIVDAGGGTIDFSSYAQKGEDFMEIAASQCVYNGSVFITVRARVFLESLLRDSRFEPDVDLIADVFDKSAKVSFRGPDGNYYVRFAATGENDTSLNIKNGQLRIRGLDIESFFKPSIDDIVDIVSEQTLALEGSNVTSVFLVGGFAASDYLYQTIKKELQEFGIDVYRPDHHINKAVADGAVLYHLDHRVKSRVSKYTFGVPCSVRHVPEDEEHIRRAHTVFSGASRVSYVPGAFDIILKRNTQVSETTEFRRRFARERDTIEELRQPVATTIQCYRGTHSNPRWSDTEREMFTVMCKITAKLDELCDTLQPRVSFDEDGDEKRYYRMDFEIALLFGLTEFKAEVIWKDSEGVEHRTPPAQVLFSLVQEDAIPLV